MKLVVFYGPKRLLSVVNTVLNDHDHPHDYCDIAAAATAAATTAAVTAAAAAADDAGNYSTCRFLLSFYIFFY